MILHNLLHFFESQFSPVATETAMLFAFYILHLSVSKHPCAEAILFTEISADSWKGKDTL